MTIQCELEAPDSSVGDSSVEELRIPSKEECAALVSGGCPERFALADQATAFRVKDLYDHTGVVGCTAPGFKLEEAPMRAVALGTDEISGRPWGLSLQPWAPGTREHWLRIVPRQITGRAFGPAPAVPPA